MTLLLYDTRTYRPREGTVDSTVRLGDCNEIKTCQFARMSPEKLHLALNHFVILLPLAALIPLVIGAIIRSRASMTSGLCIALTGSLLTGLVMETGEEAYERYEDGPVAAYLDPGAHDALEHHEELAHTWSKLLYALAGTSGIALLISFLRPDWLRTTSVIVLLLCMASVVAGLVIADSGGKIRRPDFRSEAASAAEAVRVDNHDHEDED